MTDDDKMPLWEYMTEKELIDYIRHHAEVNDKEILRRGMDSIFGRNKYKPQKENMWERLDRGKKLVKGIMLYHDNRPMRRDEND